jgi:hypothetical protein
MRFPEVEGEDLTGREFCFPRDFGGAWTIAVVAFDLKARVHLDTWVPFIDRFARSGTARGRLFPVLPLSMRMMKRAIATALRKEAPNPEAREATVTLFVDVDEFCAALNITDRAHIHTFVIEPDGLITEHVVGPYLAPAAAAIEAQLVALQAQRNEPE